ncbi:MAG: MFS transporter [Alphaproteobacteria bacterium]|nr:MFS transporter [Alphaproteobacteria bacterium]
MSSPLPTETDAHRMTPQERRSSFSLASIYAVRMLGLFMVMPVFAIEARHYTGGDDSSAVGLALGLYGLVQAALQLPMGWAADRWGRKRIIVSGLALFGIGSLLGVWATTVEQLAWARALQGGGAISAAVSALLADLTRDGVRTKAMAMIGTSIGLMFALSLVLGPFLNSAGGLSLIFAVMAALALAGILIISVWTPTEPPLQDLAPPPAPGVLRRLLLGPDLLRLNLGVFVLYAVQISTWVGLPFLLVQAGLPVSDHGWLYLPVVLLSFVVMGVTLFPLERRGRLKPLFLACIALVMVVQWGLAQQAMGDVDLTIMGGWLFLFFCGFNVLEASQPSQASRLAHPSVRATVLGVYNTLQSLGIFAGGALGGWLSKTVGVVGLFGLNAALMLLWLLAAWGMRAVVVNHSQASATHSN